MSGDVIDYLIAHGAYVEAARIAAERGEPRRAIQLYQRVWRFADALPLATGADGGPNGVDTSSSRGSVSPSRS